MAYPDPYTNLDGFGLPSYNSAKPPGISPPPITNCPFFVYPMLKYDKNLHKLPVQKAPPKLPVLHLEMSTVTLIERLSNGLHEGAPSGVFRVNISGMGERVLKIFHGVELDRVLRGYWREGTAYSRFLQSGVCSAGIVPYCYGRAQIDLTKWPMSGKHDWLFPFRDDPLPLNVLVLEFLPNASRMSLRATTPERAEAALRGLMTIHASFVIHQDIYPRNILALPDNRVVWIDFESAAGLPAHPSTAVNKVTLQEEMALAWEWFYIRLLPWKLYALRRLKENGGDVDDADIVHLEEFLVSKGANVHV